MSGVQSVGFVALNVSLTATANFRRDQSKPGMPCVPVFAAVHESGHCATQAGRARNGFAEARDWEPKSTLGDLQPVAETARPAFEPRKCPQIGVSLLKIYHRPDTAGDSGGLVVP